MLFMWLPANLADARGKGDIVKLVDGMPIRSASQLRNLIGLTPLGSRLELWFDRNGMSRSALVEVGLAKAPARRAADQW